MKSSLFRYGSRIVNGFLIAVFVIAQTLPVSALFSKPKMPSTSSIFSDMENRYHLDLDSIQDQAESFNVGNNKKLFPEVSLFFTPSDPRPGEKITAKAFPIYFSNDAKNLYYTWYLKRKGCDINKTPDAATRELCEEDGRAGITVEDWKVAAMRLLAQNGFDRLDGNYGTTTDDNDGYKARFGGDNRVNTPDHCYIGDPVSGEAYELLAEDATETEYNCPPGTSPACLEGEMTINPESVDPLTGGPAFSFEDGDVCHLAGMPTCSDNGTVRCSVGAPRCVANPETTTSCGVALSVCSGSGGTNTDCQHLFPHAPGHTTGDGSFNRAEEEFWGTNPEDGDTAGTGNKDEANVAGLGQTSFTWNYIAGDQVGVAVEGNATINTKYADSSFMIMWAFSKKNCPVSLASSTGNLTKRVKGYDVVIPTAKMDLNKCIERNLVDPTEGGQATNLEVDLTASPINPINDESIDESGDVVVAQATVSNSARGVSEMLFEWEVEISRTPQFSNPIRITKDLQDMGLLGNVKGIALSSLRLSLNIPNKNDKLLAGRTLGTYLDGGIGYLRFTTKVSESFSGGSVRKGKSDVIIKFNSTGQKISAYKVAPVPGSSGLMRVALISENADPKLDGRICRGDPGGDDKDKLDRTSCRVIKNEIIGLRIDPAGLNNFHWTINGKSLLCSEEIVSPDCRMIDPITGASVNEQSHVNFFPVSGNVGDTYTVTVTANEITTDKLLTLTRSFHVVTPILSIASSSEAAAWPKLLGTYKEVNVAGTTACPNGICPEYSESMFQAVPGEMLSFRGVFMPNFLADRSVRQWTVDGGVVNESGNVTGGSVTFAALKDYPNVYNIDLQASVVQSPGIRQALYDIWGISPLDSPEIRFTTSAQVELVEQGLAKNNGPKKYLAAIASYVPTSVIFLLRIILAVFLLIFTANVLYKLLPERVGLSPGGYFRK